MFKPVISIAAVACLGFSAGAHAQDGFFDFGKIPGLDKQPTVQIDLNPAMLGFVMAATEPTDPETAKLIAGIRGVRVFVYEDIGDDLAAVQKFVDDTSSTLERDGWHRAVFVQEGDEKVRMYVKLGEPGAGTSNLNGLTVMVTDGSGEAVFINVAGSIQPAQLGRLAGAFHMSGMLNGIPGVGTTGNDND